MGTKAVHQCECEICQSSNPHPEKAHHYRMNLFLGRLDEQPRRCYVGLEAEHLGHGGTELMSKITGVNVNTIRKGRQELASDLADRPTDRVRVAGGGRTSIEKKSPEVATALIAEVKDDLAGEPTSSKRWVRHSLRWLAARISQTSGAIGRATARRLLKKHKIGLVSNRKSLNGPSHPDRDQQFRYIKRVKQLFLQAGRPVISVDAKNKELIGHFFNKGRTWREEAIRVNAYDFRQDDMAVAVPYGIYDIIHNLGSVYVSTSYNTSEFAVEAIQAWWNAPERPRFQNEASLLILCDAGGSNNCRFWLWKYELQCLANELGISIMVCHYPTGASRYNPIEYRLFSQISSNWAGQPLTSLQTLLNFIQQTTTKTGLTVKAFLFDKIFQKGRKISDEQRSAINLTRILHTGTICAFLKV